MLNQSRKEYNTTAFLLNPSTEYLQYSANSLHSLENGFLFNSDIPHQDFNQLFSYSNFNSKNFKLTQGAQNVSTRPIVFKYVKWAARLGRNPNYAAKRGGAYLRLKFHTLFYYKRLRRYNVTSLAKRAQFQSGKLHTHYQPNSHIYHPYFINFEYKLRQKSWVWLGTPASLAGSPLVHNPIVNLDSYQAEQLKQNINPRARRAMYTHYKKMMLPKNLKNTYALLDLLAGVKQSKDEGDSEEEQTVDSSYASREVTDKISYKVILRPLRQSYKKVSRILNFRSETRHLLKNFYTLCGRSKEHHSKFHLQHYPLVALLTLVMGKAEKRVLAQLDFKNWSKDSKPYNNRRNVRVVQNIKYNSESVPHTSLLETLNKNTEVLEGSTIYNSNIVTTCKSFFYTNALYSVLNVQNQPVDNFNKFKTVSKVFHRTALKKYEQRYNTMYITRFIKIKFNVVNHLYNPATVLKSKLTKNIWAKLATFCDKTDILKLTVNPHVGSLNLTRSVYKKFQLVLENTNIKKIQKLETSTLDLKKKIKLVVNSHSKLPTQTALLDWYSRYAKKYMTNARQQVKKTQINTQLRLVKFATKKYSRIQHNLLTLYPHPTHQLGTKNIFITNIKKHSNDWLDTNIMHFVLQKYFLLTTFIRSQSASILANKHHGIMQQKIHNLLNNYWWKSKNLHYYTTSQPQTFYQDFTTSAPALLLARRNLMTYYIKKPNNSKMVQLKTDTRRLFVWFTNTLSQSPNFTYRTINTIFETITKTQANVLSVIRSIRKYTDSVWSKLPALSRAFKATLDSKFLKMHFVESRGFFKTSTNLTFLLNSSSFYHTLTWRSHHKPTLKLIKQRRQSMYSFSNALELKRMCIKRYLQKPKYNTNFKKLTKLYQTFGFGMYANANAVEAKWGSTPNFMTHSLLLDESEHSPKAKRIRFKPGYSRVWRRVRSLFQTTFFLKFRYQHRLTDYISTLDWTTIRSHKVFQSEFNQENLVFLLLIKCKFAADLHWSSELLKNNYVFINGFVVNNPHSVIIKGDFLQLLIHIKYYIVMKWQKTSVSKTKKRLLRFVGRKFKPKNYRIESDRNYRLPDWLLKLARYEGHVPSYIELDFFTLSGFMIFNPFLPSHFSPVMGGINHPRVLRLYNWKYIN